MASNRIDKELESELSDIARQQGCELLNAGFRGGVLQLVLDHPDGVTHAHCQAYSKQASAILDLEDFGRGRYVLEVSSPGLDRELYRAADYERFKDRKVRVTFFEGEERKKKTIVGQLVDFEPSAGNENGTATIREENTETEHELPLADIKVARLEIEI